MKSNIIRFNSDCVLSFFLADLKWHCDLWLAVISEWQKNEALIDTTILTIHRLDNGLSRYILGRIKTSSGGFGAIAFSRLGLAAVIE